MSRIYGFAFYPAQIISSARFRGYILSSLQEVARYAEKVLGDIVDPWEHAVFIENSHIQYKGGEASVDIYIDDDVFFYLDEGTDYRWAMMSKRPPWHSKTKPGRMWSGAGTGYVAFRGQRAFEARNLPPQPGIEARGWTAQLSEDTSVAIENEITEIMDKLF